MNRFYFAPRPQGCIRSGALLLLGLTGSAIAAPTPTSAYGQLPLSFEPNQGQTAPEVRFLSRGPGYQLYLTPHEAVLTLHKSAPKAETSARPTPTEGAVVRMHLDGTNPTTAISGQSPLPGKVNYLRGNDPKQWRTDIPTYEKVKYTNVYPGIDLVYYGRERQLEYDFIVAPGADPKAIALTFSGGELQLTEAGDLVLATATGEVRFQKPVLYQEIEGRKQPVAGRYIRRGAEQIGFEVGAYDTTHPLVIDPVLSYSTYLGGSSWDEGRGIAVDTRGRAYVTGYTLSSDFPTQAPLQAVSKDHYDAFVVKLNAQGTALVYATYLGGTGPDIGHAIAVDRQGQAYVAGYTESDDFPTTPNALQPVFGGQEALDPEDSGDAFAAKLNTRGTALVYSTYLGGRELDSAWGIAVDSRGQASVAGHTFSDDFPTYQALQPEHGGGHTDAFVAKLNAAGTAFVYSTYLGGKAGDISRAVAVDTRGHTYVTGNTDSDDFPTTPNALQLVYGGDTDAFVTKFNAAGDKRVYSTYVGGRNYQDGRGIAVDPRGQAYITGIADSDGLPTTPNALQPTGGGDFDAFVAKLNVAGTALAYATYLGGSERESGQGIAVDSRGRASVTGLTQSGDFPTQNALQPVHGGGTNDAFITQLNTTGMALAYSTYLGGNRDDVGLGIAVDSPGQVYVAGETGSDDFPTTPQALQPVRGVPSDAFVSKIAHRRK
jgi:hypothetical protein